MAYRHLEPFSRQVTILVGLTVVGFMAFGLALSFYRNVLFEQTLNTIAENNYELRQQIGGGYRELEYYRSTSYKDKYAKEHLGRINPGEKVLVITKEDDLYPLDNENIITASTQQQEAAYLELLRQMPTIEHWKLYLFDKDRLEELRQSYSKR